MQVKEAACYNALYQDALTTIRQSWLDKGVPPEEYDESERHAEMQISAIEKRLACDEPIEDLLVPQDNGNPVLAIPESLSN